ncbi:DUF1441 family protein [Sphingomonas sp. TREG-RG-20F-R18-01]|uniref:DUF1441 family protein n=1 Tax=Sphingomonas sp. TREG-RG-20F-R18-01 TaxID=2914982 RepID=UPI001F594067|nr:DUF1441 family protein [Sphingomonas sp. TREG-RG-20F-R18-01]
MISSEFDDLLGGTEPPRKKVGRPSNEERALRAAKAMEDAAHQAEIRRAGVGQTKIPEEDFLMPVSMNFLGRVFRMDPATVRKRLVNCKACGQVGGGRPVYYFHEAVPYLIKPKMDLATYLRTLNPADMPNSINKVFWEAERIKNKTLIETGEAWPTAKVLEVFGTVFMMVKDRVPLITEGMRDAGLSDEQSRTLAGFTDQFQKDLHEALVALPQQQKTFSRQVEIDPFDGPGFKDDDA